VSISQTSASGGFLQPLARFLHRVVNKDLKPAMRWLRRRIPISLIVVAILAVAVLGWLSIPYVSKGVDKNVVRLETTKTVLQLALVSTGVALLSLLTYSFQQYRLREQARKTLIRSMLDRARGNYSAVKRSRRLLRVHGLSDDYFRDRPKGKSKLKLKPYDSQMRLLDDAQLEFEDLKAEVEAASRTYGKADQIGTALTTLEGYLSNLVSEWEKSHDALFNGTKELFELKELKDLIDKDAKSGFKTTFRDAFNDLQRLLIQQLEKE
jgi:hypothetical protein